MKIKPVSVAAWMTLTFASMLCAQNPTPPSTPPSHEKGHSKHWKRGLSSLTPEEREKLKAAHDTASRDAKVQAAEEKFRQGKQEYRAAMRAAMIAADPTIEPILNKLKEAREQGKASRKHKDEPVR